MRDLMLVEVVLHFHRSISADVQKATRAQSVVIAVASIPVGIQAIKILRSQRVLWLAVSPRRPITTFDGPSPSEHRRNV